MITVLTLTYNRTSILEESIQSFLLQQNTNSELLIINDKTDLKYSINYPNIRVINTDYRFSSIMDKFIFGLQNSKHDYVYRLDDDDLLSGPETLSVCEEKINKNPGYDIYRSKSFYYLHDQITRIGGAVNNGNIFSKKYFQNLDLPKLSFSEDHHLIQNCGAQVYEYDYVSMIYRWGLNTHHVSGYGKISIEKLISNLDKYPQETGNKILNPSWKENYWEKIQHLKTC